MAAALAEIPPPPPPLPAYASTYWRAWNALRYDRAQVTLTETIAGPNGVPLSTSRVIEQPITFAAIDRYAVRYGIEGGAFTRLFRLVSAMDDEYRNVLAEQRGVPRAASEE